MDGERDGLTIRTIRPQDLDRLVRMDEAITGRNRRTWYEGKIRRALQESDLKISLGAELDGSLVGAILGSLHYGEFGVPDSVAVLDTVLLDRGFRGRGIASEMLEQLVKNLEALGIDRVRTEVSWDERELSAFLGKNGFAPAPRLVLERTLIRAGREEPRALA
ncbi:MAG TPA: GNAT family N-acetyltransferase [Thermoanaerobaculia bacterium]|nr:GNAT family N-acetyltransferase [Thermoanaerobaculia bacterium]